MANKLKPCPFCGGRAEYVRNFWRDGEWAVMCVGCHVTSSTSYEKKATARKVWNKRI